MEICNCPINELFPTPLKLFQLFLPISHAVGQYTKIWATWLKEKPLLVAGITSPSILGGRKKFIITSENKLFEENRHLWCRNTLTKVN
jgi:hypothetical protein